jgi:hypothetical protein
MRLFELTGYKSHPIYQAASRLRPTKDKDAQFDAFKQWKEYNVVTMKHFTEDLAEHGWKKIGGGHFANVYQHPNYPYVVKVFVNDSGYSNYFALMKKLQGNPHVPKVRGNIMKFGDRGGAVRMEPLTPLSGPRDPILRKYVDPMLYFTDIYDIITPRNLPFLEEKYPDLLEVIHGMGKIFGKKDWHEHNLMKRGDTLVVTDPVADI